MSTLYGTSGIANAASQTSSTKPDTSVHTGGLSTGAKAGIGVGVGVAGLIIAALALKVLYDRRRLYKPDHAVGDGRAGSMSNIHHPVRPVEHGELASDGAVRHELPCQDLPSELHGDTVDNQPWELSLNRH